MADFIDESQALEELSLSISLSKIQRIDPNAVSAEECDDCGNEIPAPRRAAMPGCRLCIDCKDHAERRL